MFHFNFSSFVSARSFHKKMKRVDLPDGIGLLSLSSSRSLLTPNEPASRRRFTVPAVPAQERLGNGKFYYSLVNYLLGISLQNLKKNYLFLKSCNLYRVASADP